MHKGRSGWLGRAVVLVVVFAAIAAAPASAERAGAADPELRLDMASVTAGDSHACALDEDGDGWCWGLGETAQLGDADMSNGIPAFSSKNRPVPVVMPAGRSFTTITAGANHTCALDDLGAAWCWGMGNTGELGTGEFHGEGNPTRVVMPAGHRFTALSAGYLHTCAIDEDGAPWCWGSGIVGQLGDGIVHDSEPSGVAVPTAVVSPPAKRLTDLDAGYSHTCALDVDGGAWCWGDATIGRLGNGRSFPYDPDADQVAVPSTPVAVELPAGRTFTALSAGAQHTCAVDDEGAGWCWGGALFGALGIGLDAVIAIGPPYREVTTPQPVVMPSGRTFDAISAGTIHTCAIDQTGATWCWGYAEDGQLGDGLFHRQPGPFEEREPIHNPVFAPVAVIMPAGQGFDAIAAGGNFTCALDTAGNGWCWGTAEYGQLGDGVTYNTGRRAKATPSAVIMTDAGAFGLTEEAPQTVTVTAPSGSSTYGAAPGPLGQPTYDGLRPGDTPAAFDEQPTCTTTATATSPAGLYPVTCSGAVADGYSFAYAAGSWEVKKAPLTVTASSGSSVYGIAPGAVTATFAGFVNGDGPADLGGTLECSADATASSNAGPYTTSCEGLSSDDYEISYVDGVWDVVRAPVALTTSASSGLLSLFTLRVTYTTTAVHALTGAPAVGVPVSITIGGRPQCAAVTSSTGVARCTSGPISVAVGLPGVKYAASTVGSVNYLPSTTTGSVPLF